MKTYKTIIEITRPVDVDADLRFAREQAEPGYASRFYAGQQILRELVDGNVAGEARVVSCDLRSDKELAEDLAFDARFPMLAKQREAVADCPSHHLSSLLDFLREQYGFYPDEAYQRILEKYYELDGKQLERERCELIEMMRKNPPKLVIVDKQTESDASAEQNAPKEPS